MAGKIDTHHEEKSNFSTPTSDSRPKSRSRLRQPFKSPLLDLPGKRCDGFAQTAGSNVDILKDRIANIDKEIDELEIEYSEDELQMHIDKLHEYNEIKDVGQVLLGKIADIEGKTTKMMYEEYGLDIED
ncbi:DNA repair protein SWI5 homolog [Dendronephthya gigantea]|uniref:DNA repair protein SWI5 homolog n=1 Tax=Dendronephthya gigantea TaxID=151771 RepID=UPI00106C9FFD|nr:DNA repair protein SWI5 homolog [Dendronephthya gigantea]XP_028394685.1 DNA repair protein SWI5 homolog [Dendronephthya gigantea]XP_028394686.1 DNA repair protein SWI5 homolog [Dendronephthya gigantea]XP_028394687.1 DNA repair protein SWI5 homolog [Dendronephthya gigantea]XP_028394688.1 DNA repair protein SWI5 homolog [Dendronephthya gigantea]XP_028394689.1 DNA repair protein SWI5 homolog [Dendronephthya gigantea]XP_028394690.1 DNA repair protein SWI5 homolog [Dendronephthya gigantea]XP_0